MSGPEESSVDAIQITVFRRVKPTVFRLPLRRDRRSSDLTEAFFFAAESQDQLVVEAIAYEKDGTEKCIAFATHDLDRPGTELVFRRGCAAVKFIAERALQPDQGDVVLSLGLQLQMINASSIKAPLSEHFHPYTPVSRSVFDPRVTVRKCKVLIRGFEMAIPRGGADVEATYETRVVLHNGYRELFAQEKTTPAIARASTAIPVVEWDGKADVTLPDVPLLPSSHLVILVYQTRRGGQKVPVALTAFPLITPDIGDCNLVVRNLPVLHGPYSSSSAARCVPCTSDGRWFEPKPGFIATFTAEYHGTPTPAPRRLAVAEVAAARPPPEAAAPVVPPLPLAESVEGRSRSASAAAVSQVVPTVPSASGPAPALLSDTEQTLPPSRSADPLPGRVTADNFVIPPEFEARDRETYALLRALADEMRALSEAIRSPAAVSAAQVRELADAEAARQAEEEGVEPIELRPQRVSLPSHVRAALTARGTPFKHPLTGQASYPTAPLRTVALSGTAIALRLDGVTIPSWNTRFPSRVIAKLSFGSAPESVLGPAVLAPCGPPTAELGTTYGLDSLDGATRGAVWTEPVKGQSREALELVAPYKSGGGSLYLQLYDAASQFYVGSAAVPAKCFERPASLPHAEMAIDAALQWDTMAATSLTGMGQDDALQQQQPFFADLGLLHITTCAIGFDLPPAAMDQPQEQQPQHHRDAAAHRVIEVKRLPGSSLAINGGYNPPPQTKPATSEMEAGSQPVPLMTLDKQNLHAQRAMHIKKALLAGAIPGVKSEPGSSPVTAGADRAEMNLRMSLADRKREEMKATRIAAHLRSRLTVFKSVLAARGVPTSVGVPFVNPYPVSAEFRLELPPAPADGSPTLKAHSAFGTVFTLLPREERTITLFAVHDSSEVGRKHEPLECRVATASGELVRIISVVVTTAPPIIARRHTLFGDPGQRLSRSLFFRAFTPSTLAIDGHVPADELGPIAVRAAAHPKCSSSTSSSSSASTAAGMEVATRVHVDPFASGLACVWETAVVTATVPPDGGERTCLVHFYTSDAMDRHLETWEVTIGQCTTVGLQHVRLGQRTRVVLDADCEHCYAFNGDVTAAPTVTADGRRGVELKVKPIEPGKQAVLVHAFTGAVLRRYLCSFVAEYPQPSFATTITVDAAAVGEPVRRRIAVDNTTNRVQTFRLSHNYAEHATLTQTELPDMQPNDRRYVTLSVRNLQPLTRYPIYVYVNDADDRTVDAFLIDIHVTDGRVAPAA